jgi:hypothetical protein
MLKTPFVNFWPSNVGSILQFNLHEVTSFESWSATYHQTTARLSVVWWLLEFTDSLVALCDY